MFQRLMRLLARQFETSDRAILLWLRWLFFLVLLFLFLYSASETDFSNHALARAGLLGAYALSNLALTLATRKGLALDRWGMPLFLIDLALIGLVLYHSIGPDLDLYLMCFVILYLATLGRRVRDALPVAGIACLLYALLLVRQHPGMDWMDPRLLLRFPFFLIFALFSSYLSQQAEETRRKLAHLQEVQKLLASELQKAMVQLRDKQAMLLQAEKLSAMGHMAGALAHEIRNPLSVIVGYVGEMLEELPGGEQLTKILQAIQRSAVRCQELMENLLNFARRPREIESFLLKDALQETLTLVRVSAKMAQVQCVLDAQANPALSARRSEVQQIFMNLMTNAVDAMPQGGTLTVTLEEEQAAGRRWIKVSVRDTGTGIPPEVRARMFEPFFTTKERGKGTGLGLSIVQSIVESYHGLLEVESEPRQGTTFIVRLPLER